jgi:hypothetical protein
MALDIVSIPFAILFLSGSYFDITSTDFNGKPNDLITRIMGGVVLALAASQIVAAITYLLKPKNYKLFMFVMTLLTLEVAYYVIGSLVL